MTLMNTERQKLTAKRDSLLKAMNSKGRWDQKLYDEIQDLEKRLGSLPEEVPKKGR